MKKVFGFLVFLLFSTLLLQCNKEEETQNNSVNIPSGAGFDLLSSYNFFIGDLPNIEANEAGGVLPYDLNMPLFSDYALKKRFVYVPEGSVIPFDTTKTLQLPVGSVLIKHFYYENVAGEIQHIETRLLIHRSNGWQSETYEWNESQTDATRIVVGKTKQLTTQHNGQTLNFNYLIPNTNQCKNCHAVNGKAEPIGPQIHNLNKNYAYTSGTANQIDTWVAKGILESPNISNIPAYPQFDDLSADLNNRARAYLAVNCASCHSIKGSAANSGLYLEYHNQDSLSLGFWKSPVAAGAGSGGFTYVIKPGFADESILLYRMISDEVNERMPEIGRDLSHQEGIALIREWIDSQ